MLDIKYVREHANEVKDNIRKKFQDKKLPLVDEVIELDKKIRELKTTKLFALLKRLSFHIPNFQLSGTDKTNNEILIYNLSK